MKQEPSAAHAQCAHSQAPDWENNLWLLATGDLPSEEEERLLEAMDGCAYCRRQLARCTQSEMRAHRWKPAAAPPPETVAAPAAGQPGLFRLVIEKVAGSLRCLEAGWQPLSPQLAGLRAADAAAPALVLERTMLHFQVQINLTPDPQGRVLIGFEMRDVEGGGLLEGRAELQDSHGQIMQSMPVKQGRGRFRAVQPGSYWIVLTDGFGLTEMLEVVVQ